MARIINHPKATRAWRFWSRVEFTGPFSLTKGAEGHCWVWAQHDEQPRIRRLLER